MLISVRRRETGWPAFLRGFCMKAQGVMQMKKIFCLMLAGMLAATAMAQGGPGGVFPGDGEGNPGSGALPGGQAAAIEISGATEIVQAAEMTGQSFVSDTEEECALRISTPQEVSITWPQVMKTGGSRGGDRCTFDGLNAAVLVMGGSTATITGGTVVSDAKGAGGVFCFGGNGGRSGVCGDGTTVVITGTKIVTSGEGSGGIITTGGGTTFADSLDVTTGAGSSPAIRSERGGEVEVEGGSFTTDGPDSPAICAGADITAKNATLVSSLSEGVRMEGMNSVTLEECSLTANSTLYGGKADFQQAVMICRPRGSGTDGGSAAFTMTGGSLTSLSGHMFHVTNTRAVITLSGVKLVNAGSDVLLSVCNDGWKGDGNTAELVADGQLLSGEILVGDNSTLKLTLKNGSSFRGCIGGRILNAKGEEVSRNVGLVDVTLEGGSTWTLTQDTFIASFEGDPGRVTGDGHVLYVGGVALEGIRR